MLETMGSDLDRQWERETTVRVMTAYVAHELNHPLGTITNLVNTLSRHLARHVVRPQDIDKHLENIKAEALRATTIIKQLRLLTERRPTTKSSVCLVNICRDVMDRLRPLADAKQIGLRLEVRTDQTQVNGVQALLGMALYNFSINSIAALDDPGIVARKLMVRIAAKTPQSTAVQVFDNGCGLPESIRDRIFEPFVTTRADGSGLGLAIAGDIVRWHRGTVSCRSRRRGTCMEMILPNA